MKRFARLAAAMLGLSLLAAVPAHADDKKDLEWQTAYQKVLTTYSRMQGFQGGDSRDDSGSRWDLFDVDGDGTPELFISPDSSHAYGVMIYTCVRGEPKLLQTADTQAFGEFGLCAVNVEQHLVGSFRTGMGEVDMRFYTLENGTLTELERFWNNSGVYPEDDQSQVTWMHGEAEVTSADYTAAFTPYADLIWKEDVGRMYAFTDRSPLSSPLRAAQSAAPPNLRVALLAGSLAAVAVALVSALISRRIRN